MELEDFKTELDALLSSAALALSAEDYEKLAMYAHEEWVT